MKLFRIFLLIYSILITLPSSAQRLNSKKVRRLFAKSEILNQHHVGFALYDLDKKQMIYGFQEDKYFTPASNTKLFTFYAGLKILKDSVPGLQYEERGDSLIFWGTGDPSFLHPDFSTQPGLDRLKKSRKSLAYSPGRYEGDFFGVGWAYDDYNEYYQPEIAELPVYGNILRLTEANGKIKPNITLPFWDSKADSSNRGDKFRVVRSFSSNQFLIPQKPVPVGYTQDIPFKYDIDLAKKLLSDTLHREVSIKRVPLTDANSKTLYNVHRDTLFKRMLLPSDNFIAEQLLLTYSVQAGLEMRTDTVINFVKNNFLTDLPDTPQWVDGSGLSRQNLFTPRSMVKLCEKIYEEFTDKQKLFDLMPQGGKTGTLRNYFKAERPFVFAKTGSLSNNHNLSGYIVTSRGKVLAFSFMNNNFTSPTADVRKEMEVILTKIHERF